MTKTFGRFTLGTFLALAFGFAALAAGAHVDGEVMKVDMDTKKVTIKHAPIEAFNMPGMTMVFQVKEAAMLDQLKVGDKIHFVPDRVNGAFTVISFEKSGGAKTTVGTPSPEAADGGHKH